MIINEDNLCILIFKEYYPVISSNFFNSDTFCGGNMHQNVIHPSMVKSNWSLVW